MYTEDEIIDRFALAFAGRTDAWGTWAGGCARNVVTRDTFKRHLNGDEAIGIYPLDDDSMVSWGCSDIDIQDVDMAFNLQMAFQVKGVFPLIEKTDKGYHVWVFADGRIPATTMRYAFLAAHEVCGIPATEVNPKQTTAVALGNYVRLPYPGWWGAEEFPNRKFIRGDQTSMPLDDAITNIVKYTATKNELEALAKCWVPPVLLPPEKFMAYGSAPFRVQDALDKAGGYVRRIHAEGPFEGHDRSNLLCKLAYTMKEKGCSIQDAYLVVFDADKRWGKFGDRVDGEQRIQEIVNMAYGREN